MSCSWPPIHHKVVPQFCPFVKRTSQVVLTLYPDISRGVQSADIIFVQNFRLPDLQGKNLSPKNCVIGDIFHYQFKGRCKKKRIYEMARYDLPTYVLHVLGHFWMFAVKITEWIFSLKSLGLWTWTWTHLPIVWDKVPTKSGFFFTPSLSSL